MYMCTLYMYMYTLHLRIFVQGEGLKGDIPIIIPDSSLKLSLARHKICMHLS